METKKVIITLTDVDTGEIYSVSKSEQLVTSKKFEVFMKEWFDCFVRGLCQDKNLNFSIVARDWQRPYEPSIF